MGIGLQGFQTMQRFLNKIRTIRMALLHRATLVPNAAAKNGQNPKNQGHHQQNDQRQLHTGDKQKNKSPHHHNAVTYSDGDNRAHHRLQQGKIIAQAG